MRKFSIKNIFHKENKTFSNVLKLIKKNAIFYVTCGLSVAIFFALAFVAYGKIQDQIDSGEKADHRTIIIDAGHGGEDGGAVGVDGIIEKDINLAISLKLRDFLEASGYDVIMVRDKDEAIYDDDSKSLREKKRSDLKNRVELMNSSKKDDAVLVSVHQNKFPKAKYFGTQIFYSVNNPKSQELATSVKESVVGLIQPENTRELKAADKRVYLLHHAQIPAITVECGFLSNEKEAKKLITDEYQKQMAFSIYCGLTNYFVNNA